MIVDGDSPGNAKPKKRASIKRFFGRAEADEGDANEDTVQPVDQITVVAVEENPAAESVSAKKSKKPAPAAPVTDENGQPQQHQHDEQPRALAIFKNGRLALSEKRLALERHPAAIASTYHFHQLVAQLTESKSLPLTEVPTAFHPLIALIVQEKDNIIATLAKIVEAQICPMVVDEDGGTSTMPVFAPSTLETAIADIAEHRNYGVLPSAVRQCCEPETADVPHSLATYRWEVKDIEMLPKDVHSAVKKRRARRAEAQAECTQWFTTVDEETRQQILAGTLKKARITPCKQSTGTGEAAATPALMDSSTSANSKPSKQAAQDLASPKRPKNILRGQKSLVNFFTLEKGSDKDKKQAVEQISSASDPKSGYEAMFHPFHLRQSATMYRYQRPTTFSEDRFNQATQSASNTDVSCLLAEFKNSAARANTECEARRRAVADQPPAVCDGVELDDAELHLIRLRSMPMKCLHFYDNRRPDYWGTWSRRLKSVSARRPFARDSVALDYDFDSDGEWCIEDDEGEELKSDDEDDEDDEDEEDEEDDTDFIVGDSDVITEFSGGPSALGDEDDDDGDEEEDLDHNGLNSDTEDDYVSEEEVMEDIDPDEEVGADLALPEPEAAEETKPTTRSAHQPRSSAHSGRHLTPKHQSDKQVQPRRKKVMPLAPIVVGPIWNDSDQLPADDPRARALAALTVTCIDCSMPLTISIDPQPMLTNKENKGADGGNRKDIEVTDDVLRILVEVLHASPLGVAKLVDELKTRVPEASKAQLERLIHEHAVKEKRPPSTRPIWCVHDSLLEKFRMQRKHRAHDEDSEEQAANDVVVLIEKAPKQQRVSGPEHDGVAQPEAD